MADYAIHDTTLEAIADTIRKKDGTSALIDPADYADRINLMGMLQEKTIVSSPIADFSDGADDVPTKSLVVTIPPTLSGTSEVTETQTGRNLLENTLTTQTVNGTTFTVNADKSITISGTPSATTRVYISSQNINVFSAMFFSFGNMPTGTRVFCSRTSGGSTTYPTISPSHTATLNADYTNFLLEVTTSFDGTSFTIYPMLEYGSTAHAYEPYQTPTTYTASLGRTIYGGQVDIVNGTGTDENGNDFTFDGQEINTRLGYNAFWSEQGDTEVTYRASGTIYQYPSGEEASF